MDDFPSPPSSGSGPAEHAKYFAAVVNAILHVTLSNGTIAQIRRLFSRFWPDTLDDFVSCSLLECLQTRKPNEPFTEQGVLLAVDRVRQRLTREAKRFQNGITAQYAVEPVVPPEKQLELVLSEFRAFLETRDSRDAFLFQRHFLDGVAPQKLADETGIPLSTVYRRLKAIQNEFMVLRQARTKPHPSE